MRRYSVIIAMDDDSVNGKNIGVRSGEGSKFNNDWKCRNSQLICNDIAAPKSTV